MKVSELITKLQEMPQDYHVIVESMNADGYVYLDGKLESVYRYEDIYNEDEPGSTFNAVVLFGH